MSLVFLKIGLVFFGRTGLVCFSIGSGQGFFQGIWIGFSWFGSGFSLDRTGFSGIGIDYRVNWNKSLKSSSRKELYSITGRFWEMNEWNESFEM